MKLGASHSTGLYTVPPASGTQVNDGAQAIWNAGLRVLKLWIAPSYQQDYALENWSSTPTTATELLQTSELQQTLNREWDTIVLNTWTFANGTTNWWRAACFPDKLQAEYQEIYDLCVHIRNTYVNRAFIISSWEGDWAFLDSFDESTHVDWFVGNYCAAYHAIRQKAVHAAIRDTANSTSTIQYALEVNRIVDVWQRPDRRRLLSTLSTLFTPDVLSYSCYDSTIVQQGGWGTTTAVWTAQTQPVFLRALHALQTYYPNVPWYLGEFGYPENEAPGGVDIMALVQQTLQWAQQAGSRLAIYWQVFDNEAHPQHTYRGYWLIRPDGTTSLAHNALTTFEA